MIYYALPKSPGCFGPRSRKVTEMPCLNQPAGGLQSTLFGALGHSWCTWITQGTSEQQKIDTLPPSGSGSGSGAEPEGEGGGEVRVRVAAPRAVKMGNLTWVETQPIRV